MIENLLTQRAYMQAKQNKDICKSGSESRSCGLGSGKQMDYDEEVSSFLAI